MVFAQADVFTITSSIVLTVRTRRGAHLHKRIRARDTDLGRVERVNALSRRLCQARCRRKNSGRRWRRYAMPRLTGRRPVRHVRAVISAAFSVFFGGTLRDAATATVSGMLLFGALLLCQQLRSTVFANYAGQRAGNF